MSKDYLASLFSLDGQVAIVTGAARGNGFAMAEALARAGASVLLVDISEEELFNSIGQLKRDGLSAEGFAIDLTNQNAPDAIIRQSLKEFGSCDILVNNAGITRGGRIFEYSREDWDLTYQTNLLAPYEISRRAAHEMSKKKSGSIINVTSLNAELAFPDNPAYVTFKGALKQLTKALALDLSPYGIRVNAIGPGYVRTNMTQSSWANDEARRLRSQRSVMGRWGEPTDLNGAVIYLASKASSFVTGIDLYVDGGWLIKGL